jgi:hypothetical protein
MSKRNRRLIVAASVLVVLIVGTFATMSFLEREGEVFYERGKEVVDTLKILGKSVQARDYNAIQNLYSPAFKGTRLGFLKLEVAGEKDGVQQLRLCTDGEAPNREAALEALLP